jgi:hypothetical protein
MTTDIASIIAEIRSWMEGKLLGADCECRDCKQGRNVLALADAYESAQETIRVRIRECANAMLLVQRTAKERDAALAAISLADERNRREMAELRAAHIEQHKGIVEERDRLKAELAETKKWDVRGEFDRTALRAANEQLARDNDEAEGRIEKLRLEIDRIAAERNALREENALLTEERDNALASLLACEELGI